MKMLTDRDYEDILIEDICDDMQDAGVIAETMVSYEKRDIKIDWDFVRRKIRDRRGNKAARFIEYLRVKYLKKKYFDDGMGDPSDAKLDESDEKIEIEREEFLKSNPAAMSR